MLVKTRRFPATCISFRKIEGSAPTLPTNILFEKIASLVINIRLVVVKSDVKLLFVELLYPINADNGIEFSGTDKLPLINTSPFKKVFPLTLRLFSTSTFLFKETSFPNSDVPLIIKLPFPVIRPFTNKRFVVVRSRLIALLGEIYPVIADPGIEFAA